MTTEEQDLATRRRRVVYRATHRGTKEMDWLLGRFAGVAVDVMDAAELGAFETLVTRPDPEIECAIRSGETLGEDGHDALVAAIRDFHGLKPGR